MSSKNTRTHTAVTEIKKTGDGSDTLISEAFSQPYHSLSGAVAESRYVYFERSGLADAVEEDRDLTVFEVGFGTGMNLILLLDYINKSGSGSGITFISVEAYPIDPKTAASIDFGDGVEISDYHSILKNIFSNLNPGWKTIEISEKVTLNLFIGTFEELEFENPISIDFVLHDPFSPESNPAGWTPELFKKIADHSADDAMLTTYSAASSARASMAVAGWHIARASGALGKREMTVASKNPEKLSHLKRVNEKRLIERFEQGDFE
jgi:tRNA U34 5-methylaminomethyl-2-thiouridine-forming methyltransferase MnmC